MSMKKSMLILACLATTFTYPMEPNSWNMISHETKITMIKGSLLDTNTDLIVVGTNQQQMLQGFTYDNSEFDLGRICYPEKNIVYIRNNNSDDNSSKLFPNYDKKQLWTHKKEMLSKVLSITEPTLIDDHYIAENKNPSWNNLRGAKEYSICGKNLATVLLTSCYEAALLQGIEELKYNKEKRITFPLLGTAVGFSTEDATLAAAAAFIGLSESYPDAYNLIELFVEKDSETHAFLENFKKMQNMLDQIKKGS
jgi:hypothetical protein